MRKTPTNLEKEVTEIIGKAPVYTLPEISLLLSLPEEDITIDFIRRYELKREFSSTITDVIFIEFLLDIPTFLKIYDKKDSIELLITFKEIDKTISKRYKAILRNKLPKSHSSDLRSGASLTDTQEQVTVILETVDPLTLALKNTLVTGIYHETDLTKLIKTLMGNKLNDLTVLGRLLDYRLNIYELDNKTIYNNIQIRTSDKEHFTKLIKLPYSLQTTDYGLYNNNIGIYFSNMNATSTTIQYDINIFPLTDYDRYAKETKLPKLLIINSSISNIAKNEYNAFFDIDTYKIVVDDVTFNDSSDELRFNKGTGIIHQYSDMVSDKSLLSVTDDDILFDNTKTFEYINVDEDISDYAKYIETDHDDNIYKYKSKISTTLGVTAIIRTPNLDPSFIYPGMPIKYMFVDNDTVKETTGIIHGVNYTININSKLAMTTLLVTLKKIKE